MPRLAASVIYKQTASGRNDAMKRSTTKWVAVLCGLLAWGRVALATELPVLAEENVPFSYRQDGEIQGFCTEVVTASLAAAQLHYQIDIRPWARIYTTTLAKPGTLMYPVARTAEREDKFQWIGPLLPNRIALFRKKGRSDVVVHKLDDARHYRIGVVNMDFREEYLRRKGFSEEGGKQLVVVNGSDLLMPMLQAGRIDLMPLGLAKCAPHGLDCSQIEPVYVLDELESGLYMVFNRGTSPALVRQVREGFERIRRNGTLARIMAPLNQIYGRSLTGL